jgi:hypothetical protein
LQHSHTPSTGILFSRLTILNLRFAIFEPLHHERRWARFACAQSFGFIDCARQK